MRRLPHRATLLRPSKVTDRYGDEVDGPLAPVGEPFPAWLQHRAVTEGVVAGGPVVRTPVLFTFPSAPPMTSADVVEIDGDRFKVEGDPAEPVNPRGRARFRVLELSRVTRGGA